jgi:hypothetical protein
VLISRKSKLARAVEGSKCGISSGTTGFPRGDHRSRRPLSAPGTAHGVGALAGDLHIVSGGNAMSTKWSCSDLGPASAVLAGHLRCQWQRQSELRWHHDAWHVFFSCQRGVFTCKCKSDLRSPSWYNRRLSYHTVSQDGWARILGSLVWKLL